MSGKRSCGLCGRVHLAKGLCRTCYDKFLNTPKVIERCEVNIKKYKEWMKKAKMCEKGQ